MTEVATHFQRIAELARRSNYNLSNVFDRDDKLRLATLAVNRGEIFADDLENDGHVFQFDSEATSDVSKDEENAIEAPPEDVEPKGRLIATRHNRDHPDVADITGDHVTLVEAVIETGIMGWLDRVYRESRGFELGSFDTSLLAVTLRHQAQKWKEFAFGYVSDVITLVHNFVIRVLEKVAPNDRVRNRIKEILLEKLREKYKDALAHVEFLLRVELEGTHATLNKYFNDALEKR